MNRRCRPLLVGVLLVFLTGAVLRAAEAPATRPADVHVDVILWFDTEDYLLPADDDAAKRLAEMLTQRGIRATFKVVGEKARVLERRGRTDVIAALRKHCIGYHSNLHSVHPTPTEYLADCNLLDGMAEFVRREGRGAADVRRIMDVPTLACYGQPGSSWASQPIAALGQIGVAPHGQPCYLDDGTHVGGFGGRPFWYCNALVVYDMNPNTTRMDLFAPDGLAPAEKEFTAIADRLRSEGGGLISIYYHPCEWVHKQFWDSVNFIRGRNPPREQWVAPPQRPPEETDAAFERFGAYIDHMLKQPNVRFITAEDLPALYVDPLRTEGASPEMLATLAEKIGQTARSSGGIDDQTVDGMVFSPADEFELLTAAASATIAGQPMPGRLKVKGLLGPDAPAPEKSPHLGDTITWYALRDTLADVRDYIATQGRVPPRVFVGPDAMSPADFLVTLANFLSASAGAEQPRRDTPVPIAHDIPLATTSHIARDTPGLFGGWIIHRLNYRAPHVLEVARWQAWTVKVATRPASN